MKKSLVLIAISALFLGCIVGDVEHTLYLEPDGSLTWTVLEHHVHSNANEPEQRLDEEAAFLASRGSGSSTLAAAFHLLGAEHAETTVLRSTRPMAAWTEARFASPTQPFERLMDELGVVGTVRLSIADGIYHLEAVIHPELGDDLDLGGDDPVLELIEDLSSYRVVLTQGHFVAAQGFELGPENRTATPLTLDDDADDDDNDNTEPHVPLVFSLSWSLE